MPDRAALVAALEAAGVPSVPAEDELCSGIVDANGPMDEPFRLAIAADADRILPVLLAHAGDEAKRAAYVSLHHDPACRPKATAHGSFANPTPEAPDGA